MDVKTGGFLTVYPKQTEEDELIKMAKNHPTKLFIGDKEFVVDPPLAIDNAMKAGIKVSIYPDGGHILIFGSIGNQLRLDVTSFLIGG